MLKRNNWKINKLAISALLPVLSLLVWFYTDLGGMLWELDQAISLSLNKSLNLGYSWKYFWAIMSLKPESYISIIIMVMLNIWYVCTSKEDKLTSTSQVVLMWLWLEVGLILVSSIFFDILHIKRDSPSLVLEPFFRLSEYFGDNNVKDCSAKSFPGGHGFAMPYIAIFSMKFVPKRISLVTWVVAIFFCLPRLMSGAHWATDIVFSIMFAYFCVNIVVCTPLYSIWVNGLANRFRSLPSFYKKIIKALDVSR